MKSGGLRYVGYGIDITEKFFANVGKNHSKTLTSFIIVGSLFTTYSGRFCTIGSALSLHLGSHFIHLLTRPRFGAESSGSQPGYRNRFRMVRIVLKITFLKLRYPKGVTGRVPLCPIMALDKPQWFNICFLDFIMIKKSCGNDVAAFAKLSHVTLYAPAATDGNMSVVEKGFFVAATYWR